MSYTLSNDPKYYEIKTSSNRLDNEFNFDRKQVHEFQVQEIRGINITPQGVHIDSHREKTLLNENISDLALGNGEWMAWASNIESDNLSHLFFGDRFGYAPIFYSLTTSGSLFVSDSFAGVAAGLKQKGTNPTLNIFNYALSISSNSPTFQNIYSNETMANEIKLLPENCALYVDDRNVALIDRELIGPDISNLSYAQLIEKAIRHAGSVLRRAQDIGAGSRRITLSGGIDSRLVAALLAAENLLEEYSTFTIDPRTWGSRQGKATITKDIIIADKIRSKYGLKWWSPGKRTKIAQGFQESLYSFQSYRSNYAFTFKANSSSISFDEPVITLRGGGGEIIRTDATIAKTAARYQSAAEADPQLLARPDEWYAEDLLVSSVLDGELRERARDVLSRIFREARGESFLEKTNNIYRQFRYRAHFGHQRQTTSVNDLILHPLSNPFFLAASKKVSMADLNSGRIVKDVFERTDSELLDIPFENDSWSKSLRGTVNEIDLSDDRWQRLHPGNSVSAKIEYLSGFEPDDRSENSGIDVKLEMLSYLKQAYKVIELNTPNQFLPSIVSLHKRAFSKAVSGSFNLGYLVAKVASALEVLHPAVSSIKNTELHTGSSEKSGFILPNVIRNLPASNANGFNNVLAGSFNIQVLKEDERLCVTIKPNGSVSPAVEFAYYLMRDGIRISTVWYSESPKVEFVILEEGNYIVECFVRSPKSKVIFQVLKSKNEFIQRLSS